MYFGVRLAQMSSSSLQPAYVLHYRNYRETSFLVELLTKYAGRVSVIARGAKRPKSPMKGLIQPFIPLVVAWRGKGSLPTLQTAEMCDKPIELQRTKLLSGFYLNELLTYVLHHHSPCEGVFALYENVIQELSSASKAEPVLRKFEKNLLHELGYALQLDHEAHTNIPIRADQYYLFIPQEGFSLVQTKSNESIFRGETLLKIASDDFADVQVLRDAKKIMRLSLQSLLGSKQIKSRELFT